MKKIMLLVLLGLFTGSLFAQDANELKNAGNTALRAKKYSEALAKYEQYLKAVDNKDNATVFNAAYCADKANNYAAAEKYFTMSIKNNYKLASSYLGKANAYKDMNKTAEMLATLKDGMKAAPGNSKLETMYATHYLKEGQKFQKANDIAKAAENYQQITTLSNKGFKTDGFFSLGTLYFNNGAAILQKATPLSNTDKEKYDVEKAKAVVDFKKAQDYLVQASSLSPERTDVKDMLEQVKTAMK